jgi:membrane-associated phospholipid phosphatase
VGKKDKSKGADSEHKAKFDPRSSRFLAIAFPVIYVIALGAFCLVYGIIPGPEFLILCFFIYAAYNNWSRRFIKDWIPFITIFLSYEAMYGVVGTISKYYLHSGPYNAEMFLFGSIPSLTLQHAIRLPALDYMGAVFYSVHFFAPTLFGFLLWRESPKNYVKYTIALGITTYAALITFLFFPVAPPWWQLNSAYNSLYTGPPVIRILTASVDKNLGIPVYRTIFDFFGANQFAAFPSLHSALPWVIALFALKIWKAKALPILILPVGVWFSAVYLGEHYVVDVLAGFAYATLAFAFVEIVLPRLQDRYPKLLRKPSDKADSKILADVQT